VHLIDIRVRSRVGESELAAKTGKILGAADYNLMLTGPARVLLPNGRPLCVYLPGVLAGNLTTEVYDILHGLRTQRTDNRVLASGTVGVMVKGQQRSRQIASTILGSVDPKPPRFRACRTTAWTGRNLPQWQALHPLLQAVARELRTHVPDRAQAQYDAAARADQSWLVPGTPFSTVTVNNTYPTGVHTDKGDLDAGFSTIATLRRGQYTGGHLVFPEYRIAADMHDGDLMLMDAHQWHGNTAIICQCGHELNGCCPVCGAERISAVSYFRTGISSCGSPEDEAQRAQTHKAATT
jgi:hypothetical protein